MSRPDDEALARESGHAYGSAIDHLTQDRFVAIAQEVLAGLSPEQRVQLVETFRERARKQDVNYPGLHEVHGLDDPDALGGLFGHLRMNAPGLLEQLLDDTAFYEPVLGGMARLAMTLSTRPS